MVPILQMRRSRPESVDNLVRPPVIVRTKAYISPLRLSAGAGISLLWPSPALFLLSPFMLPTLWPAFCFSNLPRSFLL